MFAAALRFASLALIFTIVSLTMDFGVCNPVKRSATDNCQGTECFAHEPYVFEDDSPDLQVLDDINSSISAIPSLLSGMVHELSDIKHLMLNQTNQQTAPQLHPDCRTAPSTGQYNIFPPNIQLGSYRVICDMESLPGGWIVFQRRFDGSVNFEMDWVDYEEGFGSLDGEFWIGLKILNVLTSTINHWQLRVDLEDFEHNRAYAIYDNFTVGDDTSNYQLSLGSLIQGDAGDAMRIHDLHGMEFTTKDQDHDEKNGHNCGVERRSGWWHNQYTRANINGPYLGRDGDSFIGMTWYDWRNHYNALKKTELKIRLVN